MHYLLHAKHKHLIYETLPSETPPNAYRKDIYNFQNQFVGTWVYQNGQEYLEVRFIKKEMFWRPAPTQFYEDVLVGEYKYIDSNGIEKVNSLSNLNVNHENLFNYNLYSGQRGVLAKLKVKDIEGFSEKINDGLYVGINSGLKNINANVNLYKLDNSNNNIELYNYPIKVNYNTSITNVIISIF